MTERTDTRRPIRQRETPWAAAIARFLAQAGLKPNQISILSVVFAGLSAAAMILAPDATALGRGLLLSAAAACILLRLLCNMFDGMVAVEQGRRGKSGEIYNELPDRFSDALSLAGAGYALESPDWIRTAGWAAAILAVITAYTRALGVAAGASPQFIGPLAKQQRMFLLVFACLATPVEFALGWPPRAFPLVLAIIIAGCLVTIVRRARRIIAELEAQ
jgi:phosphatidylglycerophosphate synthase